MGIERHRTVDGKGNQIMVLAAGRNDSSRIQQLLGAEFPETGGSRFWLSLPKYQLDSKQADEDQSVELTDLLPVNSGESESGSRNRSA